MTKTKSVKLLGYSIPVKLDPDLEYDGLTTFDLEKGKFGLEFRKVSIEVIAHECWHLMMRVMQLAERDNGFSFDELATEIYALTFGMLVSDVFNKLCSMDDSLK